MIDLFLTLKLNGLMPTIDFQNASDSADHSFLTFTLERFGFGNSFLKWVQILFKNQESCILNGGNTTKYFKLEKVTRKADPISAYLFILVLEILVLVVLVFLSIKENKNTKSLNVFNHTILYITYADGTSVFLKDKESLVEVMKVFDIVSSFSGLKPNKSKCEVTGIDALKGAKLTL